MNSSVSMNNHKIKATNLLIAENITAYKKRTVRLEWILNFFLIGFEYLLYVLSFLALFSYRVLPAYNMGSWSELFRNLERLPIAVDYGILLAVIFAIYALYSTHNGLYKWDRDIKLIDDTFTVCKAVFLSFLIALGLIFFLQTGTVYSRLVIFSFAVMIVVCAFVSRLLRMGVMLLLKRTDIYSKNVLIIGAGRVGEEIRNNVFASKTNGYRFVGFLDDYKAGDDHVIGSVDQVEKLLQHYQIHEIYITIPSERKLINELITKIRKYDVRIKIIPEMFEMVTSGVVFDQAYDYPCIEIVKTPLRGLNLILKRAVDIVLASLGLIVISPMLAVVAICIKLDSKGPIMIKQRRIGKNGAPFNMYKFRSMVENAESLIHQLAAHNEADGPVFKMKNDPRITRVGRFIRKYSIDELPQLINVVFGQMSLVGPRPPLPQEVERYTDYEWRRLDIRPGITGLWQINGRSDLPFDEWVKLDLYYIEHWSLGLELKIIFKTIPIVIKGTGAY
ncbi:sugar transferase [Paenibacillus sp. TH7-28]